MMARQFDNALHVMEVQGGGFVKSLAACYYAADSTNRPTLRAAFAKYFDEYEARFRELSGLSPATPMPPPVATDDAQDAARYRKLRAQSWHASDLFVVAGGKSSVRLGVDCPRTDRLDEAVDALPTPAAKPAEPTLPTQGDAK